MNIQETLNRLLNGERVRMAYDDFPILTEYIQNADDNTYNQFKNLVSYDCTLGAIPVLEVELR